MGSVAEEDFDHPGCKKPARVWKPTYLCGCGKCRFHQARVCPLGDDKDSVMLYASSPRNIEDK